MASGGDMPAPLILAPDTGLSEDLPWSDPIGPDARLLGRLSIILGMLSTEAAAHPDDWRHAPDWVTLRQVADVFERLAATPDPARYLRQAMKNWRIGWATRDKDPEPVDPVPLYLGFGREGEYRQTLVRADTVYVEGDRLVGPDGVLAVLDPATGEWITPDGAAWSGWVVAPLT
jgi:hypothetical protein